MSNLAASREVSKPKTAAKPYAPRGGESEPERLNDPKAPNVLNSLRMNVTEVRWRVVRINAETRRRPPG